MITLPSPMCAVASSTPWYTQFLLGVWGQILILLKTKSDSESRVSEGTAGSSTEKTAHIFLGPKYFALFHMDSFLSKTWSLPGFILYFFISIKMSLTGKTTQKDSSFSPLKTSKLCDELKKKVEMKNSYEVRARELKHLSLVKGNTGIFLRRNEGWLEKDCNPRETYAPVFPGGQISQVGTCCEKELFPEQINSLLREHCHLSPYTPREIGLSKEILVWNWWGSSLI